MKRTVGLIAATALVTIGMAGCGSSGGSGSASGNYCADIKAGQAHFSNLSPQQLTDTTYNDAISAMNKVADEAPSDIKSSWQTVVNALQNMSDTLKSVGLSFSDLSDTSKLQSLTPAQLAKLQSLGTTFDSAGLKTAFNKIDAEAKSECHLNFNFGG